MEHHPSFGDIPVDIMEKAKAAPFGGAQKIISDYRKSEKQRIKDEADKASKARQLEIALREIDKKREKVRRKYGE